jgi:tetratricopeptide (TPR) repeat protein
MSPLAIKSRYLLAAICLGSLVIAGCGGAETRKAKHLEKGQAFLVEGNLEKARVEFRNALQIAPNDSEARFQNGVVDEKLGNPREAAQFYQGAIDSNSDNVKARVSLGRLFLFSGAPDSALEIIKPSLVLHPDDAGLLTVRAAARTQLKDPDGALQDAERAVHLAPNNEDAVSVLAGIYKSLGQIDKAKTLLENTIKQVPGTVDLRLALAQLYASQGQEPQVEALLIDLVRLKPSDKAHRLRLAQYYARLNHVDEAERVLRDAIKTLPNELDLKVDLVQFLTARRGRDAAAKELAAMIAANPKDYELKFAQAAFFEQGKELDKAKGIYKEVIAAASLDPAGITARNRLAVLLVQNNDTAGAEKLLAEVLAKNPRDNDALILRGNLALAHKDPKTAIADLRSVLRDQPNAIGVMRALARAHLANGEPALAEETMRRAVDANPKDPSVRLDLAQLLVQLGKPEQAKPVIDELVKQEPNNVAALEAQFRVAAATKDTPAAKAAADAMVATQPKAALGYFYQGAVAETEKKLDDALRFYSVALDMQPDATEPLQGVTRVLVESNRAPEALKRLDGIAARFPKLPFASNIKGEILLGTHRTAEAKAEFSTAIERDPKWAPAYRNLAMAKIMDHDSPGAVVTLQAGISKVERAESLEGELANLYERMNKPDDAIQVYEAMLRKDPGSDVAANNLAMLLITYKKDPVSLDRAKALSAKFSVSTNPSYLDTYGWVLYKRGESAAAVEALQAALAKTPDSPVSLYHLGMAQASAGQSSAARDNLTRSLKSGKNFSGMDEAKATLDKLATLGSADAASPKS